jgi:hypothetical protein
VPNSISNPIIVTIAKKASEEVHQISIIKNLQKYLNIINIQQKPIMIINSGKLVQVKKPTDDAQQNDSSAFIQKLIAKHTDEDYRLLEEGLCFGFALCHAAMDIEGDGLENKLDWWEAALKAIANWDEKKSSLSENLILINQDVPATLGSIFERMISYILFNFAASDDEISYKEFMIAGMEQENILNVSENDTTPANRKPVENKKSYFELEDKNGKTHTVQAFERIAGSFDNEKLAALLDEKTVENNIFLITNIDHTIRFGYTKGKWLVYDPNYPLKDSESINKVFLSKEDAISEVVSRMGNDLAITAASLLNPAVNFFPAYKQMVADKPLDFVRDHGLHRMARYAPDALNFLIENVAKDNTVEGEKIREKLFAALVVPDSGEFTGLHMMARCAPQALNALMGMICNCCPEEKANYKKIVNSALGMKTHSNVTGLKLMIRCAPEALITYRKAAATSSKAITINLLHPPISKTIPKPIMVIKSSPEAMSSKVSPIMVIKPSKQLAPPVAATPNLSQRGSRKR